MSRPASTYVRIEELGVPRGRLQTTIDRNGRGRPRLDIMAFGRADQITVESFDDIRNVTRHHASLEPVIHKRSAAGIADEQDGPLRMSVAELIAGDPTRPYHSVVHLKIDPCVNLLLGDVVPGRLTRDLPEILERQVTGLAEEVDRIAQATPERWPARPDLRRDLLQVLPLRGLDVAEVILVARAARLEALCHVEHAVRRMLVADLSLDETILRTRRGTDRVFGELRVPTRHRWPRLRATPLLAYCRGVVGIPAKYVAPSDDAPDEPRPDREAIGVSAAVIQTAFRDLPGGAVDLDAQIDRLGHIYASPDTPTPPRLARFSNLGQPDVVVPGHAGWLVDEPNEDLITQSVFQPWTFGALSDLLRRSLDAERRARHSARETHICLLAFPPGFRHRQRPGVNEEPLQHDFGDLLDAAGAAFLRSENDTPYPLLRDSAREGFWSYTRTNAALALLEGIASLLTDRAEIEMYIDLVPPLLRWLAEVQHDPSPTNDEQLAEQDRIYNHLERLMHARSHRDAPHRTLSVNIAFEARAGYVFPRDCFQAYLHEVCEERLGSAVVPMLVDGSDSRLSVKEGLGVGLFLVSALRLSQPLLWPNIAHEVEHIRQGRLVDPSSWSAAFAELGRAAAFAIDEPLPRGVGRAVGAFSDDLGRLLDWLESSTTRTRDLELVTLRSCLRSLGEIACDLAIVDAGALRAIADRTVVGRLWVWCAFPNIAMDLRERAGVQTSKAFAAIRDGQQRAEHWELGIDLALRISFRIANVMLLCADPGRRPNVGEILEAIEDEQHTKMVVRLLSEVARRGRHDSVETLVPTATILANGAKNALVRLVRTPRFGRVWVAALPVFQAVRRTSSSPVGPAGRALAKYVEASFARGADEEICPPLYPRGGLADHEAEGRAQAAYLPDLYEQMRSAVREHRLHCFEQFVDGELVPAPVEPSSRPSIERIDAPPPTRRLIVHYPKSHVRDSNPWEIDLIRAAWQLGVGVAGVDRPSVDDTPTRGDVTSLWRAAGRLRRLLSALEVGFVHLIMLDGQRGCRLPIHVGATLVMTGDSTRTLDRPRLRWCLEYLSSFFDGDAITAPEKTWCRPAVQLDDRLRQDLFDALMMEERIRHASG